MADAFAIMHTWPDVRNAEYEVLQRIIAAAERVGQSVAVIDNSGCVLWASRSLGLMIGAELPKGAVRYIISLHFESPRVLDFYSYYALWQPIQFYYDFGYAASADKFLSHNDLLSCDSDFADAHALNLFAGHGREPLDPLVRLYHAPSGPYHEPHITEDARLFYIGINWERIGRAKGRFHDTLVALDEQNLTDIYGPQKILGVAPWEGFKTYKGELPFDGHSVMRAINRAGICLALSSAPHRATGIMSNRLFEGFAGGAAVIATPNPIIDKYFKDCVYLVDDSRGEEVLGQMITEAVREIRSNRALAMERALAGQKILKEVCSLEKSLLSIADQHDKRVAHFRSRFLSANAEITIVLVDDYGDAELLRKRLADYAQQQACAIDLHLVCDEVLAARLAAELSPAGAMRSLTIHGLCFTPQTDRFDGIRPMADRSGALVSRILTAATTPYCGVSGVTDIIFSDHLSSLARALDERPQAGAAVSGLIVQTHEVGGASKRSLGELRFAELDTLLLVNGPCHRGRFLFRTSLIDPRWVSLMSLLDGEEIRLLQLEALLSGELAQTGYASMVSDETITALPRPVAETPAVQQQYIRDRFLRDPRWVDRLTRGAKLPEFVFAYAPGAPVRWQDFTLPTVSRPKLGLNEMVPVKASGRGLDYLGAGFSVPEPNHVWLAAERGIIEFCLDAVSASEAPGCEIVLQVIGRRSLATGREQHCTVVLNGATIAYLPVPEYPHEMRIAIPQQFLRSGSAYRLELVPDHSERGQPSEGESDDRHVSLALMAIGIVSEPRDQMPKLHVGLVYSCGSGELGAAAMIRGFYTAEPDLTWIAGTEASIYVAINGKVRRPALLLDVRARRADNGDDQIVTVTANHRRIGRLRLSDGRHRLVLPLDEIDMQAYLHFGIGLNHAEVTRDGDGRILDGRLLGCAIFNIGLVDVDSFADLEAETRAMAVSSGDELR